MFRSGITVARVWGIPIRLHVSLLVALPFITWSLATHDLPALAQLSGIPPGSLRVAPLVLALLLAVAVFFGVLLHELGHALTARAQGAQVKGIVLMVLGGVTEIEHPKATPGQQFRVAIAGPLVSAALGGLALAPLLIDGLPVELHLGLLLFGAINLFIAAFNLIPAFPMDGGRILRAALRSKFSETKATDIAAIIGRVLAAGAIAQGLVSGQFGLILVGGFVFFAAGLEARATRSIGRLEGLLARQAATRQIVVVGALRPAISVARDLLFHGADAAIVRDPRGVVGAILAEACDEGSDQPVGELLSGRPLRVHEADDLRTVFDAMRAQERPALMVDDSNTVVGVITFSRVMRAARLKGLSDAARDRERARLEAESY